MLYNESESSRAPKSEPSVNMAEFIEGVHSWPEFFASGFVAVHKFVIIRETLKLRDVMQVYKQTGADTCSDGHM